MLFPESSKYYSSEDREIQGRIAQFKEENLTINRSLWQEQLIDSMYEAGDMSLWDNLSRSYPGVVRPIFNLNQLRRIKGMMEGYQREHRKSSLVIPIENGDQETADQYTKIFFWNNNQNQVLQAYSNAFSQALVAGLSLLNCWVDFRDDPISGDVKTDVITYDSFLIDANWKKMDFSDCNGIWRRTCISVEEMFSLLPRASETINDSRSDRDNIFNYMPESRFNGRKRNLIDYDEFYYRTFRDATILVDPQSGEQMEFLGTKDELRDYVSYFPHIQVLHMKKPTVKLAVLTNGKVQYHGPNICGIDKYPYVPVVGYMNPTISDYRWRIQGVIRALRDAAFLSNRVQTILLNLLEAKLNAGWVYVEGKLVNPMDTYKTGEGQNIVLKAGAEIGRDLSPIVAQEIPSSYFQLLEGLNRLPEVISGANEELLGSATDDKAGILGMIRQGAGLITLKPLYDNLDTSQHLYERIRLETIQRNFTPGKVRRILNEEPAPQFYSQAFGKYDVSIEDGLNTTTQKQQNFAQILQLAEYIKIPVKYMLENVTIQNKAELIKAIEEEQQQEAQMAQQQQQVQMQELQARAELSKARAMADTGLGMERMSRIQENEALADERRAAAIKDEEAALLNLVRAANEMDDVSLNQLTKLMTLKNMISQPEGVAKAPKAMASKKQPVRGVQYNTASKIRGRTK